jgi:hypothetical protein
MKIFMYIIGAINLVAAIAILAAFLRCKSSLRDSDGDELKPNE